MVDQTWSARHITDSTQQILLQIPARANDRAMHVVDSVSIVQLALWSLLLWERKVGRVAIERLGVDAFDLARGVDRLLTEKAREHPVAYEQRRGILVMVKTGEPYQPWDFESLLEPMLQQAEHEAMALVHNYVGSEHLVLAIVRQADPSLVAVLDQFGIRHEEVKEKVLEVLKG